ncbi:MAG: hypothetical protein ACFFEV_05085, partial [Candidatus Thorarchaeota archaeon]
MTYYNRLTKLVSIRFLILTVLAMLVVITLPSQGVVNVNSTIEPQQRTQTLSEIGALATVERSLIGSDGSTDVSFELPVKFGFSEESGGSIAVATRFENLIVVNSNDILTLTKIGCTLKTYPFLYINGVSEFDYWADGVPAEVLSGPAAEFDTTLSVYGTEGLVSAEDIADITVAGVIFVFENLTATFGTGPDAVSIRTGPESITMGVNFTLSLGVVTTNENIDYSNGSDPISYVGDDVLVEFSQSLPTKTASLGLVFDPITISLIV